MSGSRDADWFRNVEAQMPAAVFLSDRPYNQHPQFLDTDEIAGTLAWSQAHRRRNPHVQAWFFH